MRLVIAAFTLTATLLGPAVAAATIHDRDAVHCEFYVDGVGRGHTYYTWYFRDWLDVYLRWDRSTFAAQGDSVIGAVSPAPRICHASMKA